MYKAAIFDLDGTIADTVESIAFTCNKALEECGFKPIETGAYRYFAGDGTDTLIRKALLAAGDRELAYFEKAYQAYQGFFKKGCVYKVTAFAEIKETLDIMKQQGMKLAVVTNKPHLRAVQVVETVFGKGYFDEIIGQQEGLPKKPDPKGVSLVLERFLVTAKDCIYVGDTDVDMKTGNRAGIFTIGVLWGFRLRKELEENHAHKIIKKPSELLGVLSNHL